MKIKVTGDIDIIAHSAWISTVGEMRANSRTKEDQERVVKFLVENHHTSPLESVTISFYTDHEEPENTQLAYVYGETMYGRVNHDGTEHTIDLLNFCKATKCDPDGRFGDLWKAFAEARPKLAEILQSFGPIKDEFAPPVNDLLGDHNMSVQLVQLHDTGSNHSSRATWRVRCPLSVSVQILRHRTGAYNQVSGRYKTIRQKMMNTPDDCAEIAAKMGEDLDRYMGAAEACIARYLQFMRKAKQSRDKEVISNNEYKRLREVARFILPEGRMTELYITYYLDDFYDNYLKLRDSEHAQTEHIWVAQEMRQTLEKSKE